MNDCVFCNLAKLDGQIIRSEDLYTSFISNPHFRVGQCLVIPNRHVVRPAELTADEGAAIMAELGRLGSLLDGGFGSGIMQKYQPLQAENGIKVNHLHFHVFPRKEHETGLFPVPEPNSFEGFTPVDAGEARQLIEKLQA